jgi:DNA polymerase-3 subunit delta
MILKFYELNKINILNQKYFLFYGNNEGLKKEEISKLHIKSKKKLFKFDEKQILENPENFLEDMYSGSLFENEKFVVINHAGEKILKIIQIIIEKNPKDISILINAGQLDKKSKLRSNFEKEKELIAVGFYPDTNETLTKLAQNFIVQKKISLSQMNINFIVNKCNGNREFLKNELEKIELLSKSKKNITLDNLIKLINLNEDFSISELVDYCLAKDQKKTFHIINENNFNIDDSIIITRTFLNKLKRILILSENFNLNKNLDKTINEAKPPIFWKDKEIVKKQIKNWSTKNIQNLIIQINQIELQIKLNSKNALNYILDFIIEKSSTTNN